MQRSTKSEALQRLAVLALPNTDASFVLNVIMTHHAGKAAYIVGLARLLELGHTVRIAQFSIDTLVVDDFHVAWDDLKNAERLAKHFRPRSRP